MNSVELKQKFIEFFESKGHKRIANSSLIPENDPSALFTNSGMHPLVPFLLGQPHPLGTRLTNYQRAVRTGDIEIVGDNTHHTFFEMLGEWSLGDYGKKESITWTTEFLVDVLGFDPKRLYPSIYKGSATVPRDEEAIAIWKDIFKGYGIDADVAEGFEEVSETKRIVALGDDDNFWKVGSVGPCGPTTEVYYNRGLGENADKQYLEVVNNVFMSYNMTAEGVLEELTQKNIDVGWGFERLVSVVENMLPNGDVPLNISAYETSVFNEYRFFLLETLGKTQEEYDTDEGLRTAVRVMLDHIRASVMIIADGIEPSNKDQGYVLRRLIRRAVTFDRKYSENTKPLLELANKLIEGLSKDVDYGYLVEKRDQIINSLSQEINKFETVLRNGIKELNKIQGNEISGEIAFRLKESAGLPLEIVEEIAKQQGKTVDVKKYGELMDEHQEKSRTAAKGKFVGGLGDHSPESVRYHTCAHLFLAAAQKVLGDHVKQKGQNITPERLRYDISHPTPISPEDIKKIEDLVNEEIEQNLSVDFVEVTNDEADKMGAEGVFGQKYEGLAKVKVYRVFDANKVDSNKDPLSYTKSDFVAIERCGGPHVSNTSEIKEHGKFKIVKEESSGGGVRRIKAVLAK